MTATTIRSIGTGMPIEIDGAEVRIRFTLLSLARCEAAYGNLDGLVAELRWLAQQLADDLPDRVDHRVAVLLQHVFGADAPVDADTPPAECIEALVAAWQEARSTPEVLSHG